MTSVNPQLIDAGTYTYRTYTVRASTDLQLELPLHLNSAIANGNEIMSISGLGVEKEERSS